MNRQTNKPNCFVQYYLEFIIVFLICVVLGVCLYLSSYQALQHSNSMVKSNTATSGKSALATTSGKSAIAATSGKSPNVQISSKISNTDKSMKISEVVFRKSALAATSGKSALVATSGKLVKTATSGKPIIVATSGKSALAATSIKHRKSARRYYKSRKYRALARKNSKAIRSNVITPVSENSKKSNKRVVKLGKTFIPIQINPEKPPNMNMIEFHEVVVPVSMVNLVTNQ